MREEVSYGVIPLKKIEGKWHLLLVQHRLKESSRKKGHWSFPKGHPEEEESALETAKRELFEETGLTVVHLLKEEPFLECYQFLWDGETISKQVVYFLAEVEGNVVAQVEEIAAIEWVPLEEGEKKATFPEGKRLCREVGEFLVRYQM